MTLGPRPNTNLSPTRDIVYRATCRELTSLLASGVSTEVVNASERLEGDASGSSILEYIGNPVIAVNVSGTATVRPR